MGRIQVTSNEAPKLYQHCVSVYDLMVKNADETDNDKIFIGSLATILDELGLAQSYQSKITSRLRAMACISLIKRGGGQSQSEWLLHEPPTIELFRNSDSTGDMKYQRAKQLTDALEQRYMDLARRVSKLEEMALDQGWPI